MDSINSAAVVLSNILTIIVVLASLWFARAGYMTEQRKVLDRIDAVSKLFDHWESWRTEHEEWAQGKMAMLSRSYDTALTHTAQIAELDRRLVRWEERALNKAEQK